MAILLEFPIIELRFWKVKFRTAPKDEMTMVLKSAWKPILLLETYVNSLFKNFTVLRYLSIFCVTCSRKWNISRRDMTLFYIYTIFGMLRFIGLGFILYCVTFYNPPIHSAEFWFWLSLAFIYNDLQCWLVILMLSSDVFTSVIGISIWPKWMLFLLSWPIKH
jgi:hypothetical protein